MKKFQPLLAERKRPDIAKLRYPVMVSPKLDGIRCVKLDGKALTRKLKPIPNDYVRNWVETNLPDGIDGELMLRDHRTPFKVVSSAIMKKTGEPDFVFCAFDTLAVVEPDAGLVAADVPFELRYAAVKAWVGPGAHHLMLVPHIQCDTPAEVQEVFDSHIELGYEGTMIRSMSGPYKFGRSTLKEGTLLKLKLFEDDEATVIGFVEQMHNENEATTDNLGHTKRSTAKAGKVGTGLLGAFKCRMEDGTEFEVGTGFDEEERVELWKEAMAPHAMAGDGVIGKVLKFKHQPPPDGRAAGESPRFPVFLGWRDASD